MHTCELSTPGVDKTPSVGSVTRVREVLTPEEIVEMIDRLCDLDTTRSTILVLMQIIVRLNTDIIFSIELTQTAKASISRGFIPFYSDGNWFPEASNCGYGCLVSAKTQII